MSTLSITPGSGALVRTDLGGSSGAHMQVTKLAESVLGSDNLLPATVANGLLVNVSQVQGTVAVTNATPGNLKVDASGATVPVANAGGGSLLVNAPVATPVAVRISNGSASVDTIPVAVQGTVPVSGSVGITGTPAVTQSGAWNVGTVASITNPVTVSGTVALSGTSPVSGTVTANQGTPNTSSNAWPCTLTDGTNTAGVAIVGSLKALNVNVLQNAPGGGVSQADKTAFVEGSGMAVPIAGVLDDTPVSNPAQNQASAVRITALRGLHVNLRSVAGTEIGTAANAVRTDPIGTTAQPVTGNVTVTQAAGSWIVNSVYLNGTALVAAAAGIQKVGISDGSGNNIAPSNPLAVQNAPSSSNFWKMHVAYSASQTAQTIHAPASGKTVYVEGLIIVPTAAGATLSIYDQTNAGANMLFGGQPPVQGIVITPARPIPLSAINNILRYDTGASAGGDITAWGYEA